MSKTLETNLWAWLKRGCHGHFEDRSLHMERVENLVSSGTPDVDGCLAGASFKLELKTAARPAGGATTISVGFTPAQVPWLERRAAAGGSVFVLIQVGSGHAARRYLIHGGKVSTVASGATEAELSRLSHVPFDATAGFIIETAARLSVRA